MEKKQKKIANGIEPWTTPKQLLGEDHVTAKSILETWYGEKSPNPFVDHMSSFKAPALRSNGHETSLVGHHVGKEWTLHGTDSVHESMEVSHS